LSSRRDRQAAHDFSLRGAPASTPDPAARRAFVDQLRQPARLRLAALGAGDPVHDGTPVASRTDCGQSMLGLPLPFFQNPTHSSGTRS
jgi:hypothetical protein